jgi:hypothetical protein
MISVRRFVCDDRCVFVLGRFLLIDVDLDILAQLRLIALQRENVSNGPIDTALRSGFDCSGRLS